MRILYLPGQTPANLSAYTQLRYISLLNTSIKEISELPPHLNWLIIENTPIQKLPPLPHSLRTFRSEKTHLPFESSGSFDLRVAQDEIQKISKRLQDAQTTRQNLLKNVVIPHLSMYAHRPPGQLGPENKGGIAYLKAAANFSNKSPNIQQRNIQNAMEHTMRMRRKRNVGRNAAAVARQRSLGETAEKTATT